VAENSTPAACAPQTQELIWESRLSFPVVASERPEMTSQDEKSKKAKTMKGN